MVLRLLGREKKTGNARSMYFEGDIEKGKELAPQVMRMRNTVFIKSGKKTLLVYNPAIGEWKESL